MTNDNHKKVGILSFQGDIEEHEQAVNSLGYSVLRVKTLEDLKSITHLILPGGESTVIGKFLASTGLDTAIRERVKNKTLQVYGTCAGAILLAREVDSKVPVNNLGLIDVHIARNAYGTQLHSFAYSLEFLATHKNFEAIFIRAPKILSYEDTVRILCFHENNAVMLEQENVLISTFHPELVLPAFIHKYFLEK